MPEQSDLNYGPNLWQRAFLARWDATQVNHEAIAIAKLEALAKTLIFEGVTLIPSDNLLDNEVVVSREVYKAACLLIEEQHQTRREVKDAKEAESKATDT